MIFRTINSVINPIINPPPVSPLEPSTVLCGDFLHYFTNKIASIRLCSTPISTDYPVFPLGSGVFDQFEPVSLSELSEILLHIKISNCPLDLIPTELFKEVFRTIWPIILILINSCLRTGIVSAQFKHAIVHPLLKRPNLDPSLLCNFRPVSKLSFLLKVLTKDCSLPATNIFERKPTNFIYKAL